MELVLWGMAAVNFQRLFAAARAATRGDEMAVVHWSRPPNWKRQTLTPSASSPAVWAFASTKRLGPIVVEVPPSGAADIFGTVVDAWSRAIEDVGLQGLDRGNGAKYLVVPPGYDGDAPDGYTPLRPRTFGFYVPLRIVPKDANVTTEQTMAMIDGVRVYPLSEANAPRYAPSADVVDALFDSTIPYDVGFFEALDRTVQEEPAFPEDMMMADFLATVGIVRGQPFTPDGKTRETLTAAALDAKVWLNDFIASQLPFFYPNAKWQMPTDPRLPAAGEAPGNGFVVDGRYLTAARGTVYYMYDAPPKHLGVGSFYLLAQQDRRGQPLDGGARYSLRVPPNVPVGQFWSVTVYDYDTMAFFREVPCVALTSHDRDLHRNVDGSVDVCFAPVAPESEINWLPTTPGHRYIVLFRFYQPTAVVADRTWQLPDIESMG